MKLGIVGSEAQKFTSGTEHMARQAIRAMIKEFHANMVISGRSPLGGIDWWAVEEAVALGVPTREYEPRVMTWAAPGGFRTRNLKIALDSDAVVCVTLKDLPPGYQGMRFPAGCYHCKTLPEDHVKSGGCWTMKQARRQGKRTVLVVVGPAGTRIVSHASDPLPAVQSSF